MMTREEKVRRIKEGQQRALAAGKKLGRPRRKPGDPKTSYGRSEASRKNWLDPEYRAKVEAHYERIGAERRGVERTEEVKAKISDGVWRSWHSGTRKKRVYTPEGRANLVRKIKESNARKREQKELRQAFERAMRNDTNE